MTTLSVAEIPEHPKWKRVTEEVAYLLFGHGSKVYGWNLHSLADLAEIKRRIACPAFASSPLGWVMESREMALGGDRTVFWVETE